VTIIDACKDEALFARWFRDRTTWQPWFAFIAALFGVPMTPEQLATNQACTGRSEAPAEAFTEAWLICGRRAGKSFVLALIAVFLACFKSYGEFLGPGERATVMVIATDRRQARVIFRYIRGMIASTPLLADLIERETADTLDLTNGVTIEVGTASYRSTRGYTLAAVLCDEIAFWPTDDSAEPD
jgi:phage terminase large subunit-like protein